MFNAEKIYYIGNKKMKKIYMGDVLRYENLKGIVYRDYTQFSDYGHIDTGFAISSVNSNKLRIKHKVIFDTLENTLFGIQDNSRLYWGNNGGEIKIASGTSVFSTGITDIEIGKIYEFDLDFNTKTYIIDGVVYTNLSNSNYTGKECSLLVGASNINGNLASYTKDNKTLEFQVYENDVLVVDLVSASFNDADNGVYDKINKKYLSNSNTTGSVTSKDFEVVEMDYTQFRGTGYIDTGYYITSANNDNTIIELEVAFMGGNALFGFNKQNGPHNEHMMIGSYNGKAAFRWGSSAITYGEIIVLRQYYKMRINTITKEFSVDGKVISGGVFDNLDGINEMHLGMFFYLDKPTTIEIGAINVKSLVVNVDGEDVVNIKPASINNNAYGLWDRISRRFLMNINSVGSIESKNFVDFKTLDYNK